MTQPQVRVNWTVEVNEPEPIDVVVPSSQEQKKDALTVNNKSRKSLKELRERNRKRNEVNRTEMSVGIHL
jgi:hypothetical protein